MDKTKTKIAAAVTSFFRASNSVGMIVGVCAPGTCGTADYWSFAEGCAQTRSEFPPNRQTVWQIGSITKTVTATLLATAVLEGRLEIDDPVFRFVPAGVVLPTYTGGDGITTTIRFVDLGTQTAALPLDPGPIPAGGYTIEAMYAYIKSYALVVPPGRVWNYSNVGFGLLANVLASLGDFDNFSAMFADWKSRCGLALDAMVITPCPGQRSRMAWGYDGTGQRAPWRTATWPAFNGSGALYATLDAMMEWLAFNLGCLSSPFNDALPITQRVYFDDGDHMMGLAWQHFSLPSSGRYLGKDGQTNGFSSFIGLLHHYHTGVVVLCNNSEAHPQTLAAEILQILIDSQSSRNDQMPALKT